MNKQSNLLKIGKGILLFLFFLLTALGVFVYFLSQKVKALTNKPAEPLLANSSVPTTIAQPQQTNVIKETTIVKELVTNSVALEVIAEKLRGVFYIPRLSPAMDFWRELKLGTITFTDIEADLDQLKSLTDLNAIRIFTYYDYEYRNAVNELIAQGQTLPTAQTNAQITNFGWTDGKGNHNDNYLAYLQQFITLCSSRNIEVIITTLQELPALKDTDNWDFLENDIQHYQSFMNWFVNGIKEYENVKIINLINEPDGYGVWGNEAIAKRVLIFLKTLKDVVKTVNAELKIMITSTTHDNNFCRFPSAPVGCNSIYELTDIVSLNSFLFADTGFRSGIDYKSQFEYLVANNKLKKPAFLSECGFPSHYAQQEVEGYEIINEDGTSTNVNATFTRSSIVPIGGIFDRPKGTTFGMSHTVENQERCIQEAFFWAEHFDFMGGLVWSAYDHSNAQTQNVYRDSFGIISKTGVASQSVEVLKNAFTNKTDVNGKKHISLIQGEVINNARINALMPFDYNNPQNNTPNGVFLGSDSIWTSSNLPFNTPVRYNLLLQIRDILTVDEVLVFSLIAGNVKVCDFRYKRYTVNAFQQIDPNGEIDYGFSQAFILPIAQPITFSIELSSLKPKAYLDNVELVYSNSSFTFEPWMLSSLKLKVRNLSNSAIDLLGLEVETNEINQALILA